MKSLLRLAFILPLAFSAVDSLRANEYKSDVVTAASPLSITVPDDRFLTIRTFTQNGGNSRGLVTVTMLNGQSQNQNVLSASIMPPDSATMLESVNSVVIAGPALVSVTCTDVSATCFVTYRKESDQ
jgi:hypothetical protein